MAEITVKRNGELLRQVFQILLDHPEGLQAKEVLERVERSLPLTDFEKSTYSARPNIRRFEKIVRFATISTVKAGWLQKNKGQWIATEEGKQAFSRFVDPERFTLEARKLYKQWEATQPEVISEETSDSPDVTTTYEEAVETAWAEIQQYLQKINPYDFQNLVASLLRAMGYHVSWVAPPGQDGGD